MTTLMEWKITDAGYMRILDLGQPMVYFDPYGVDRWDEMKNNTKYFRVYASLELEYGCAFANRVIDYWLAQKLPRLDRSVPAYEAPWFPWLAAGFSEEEREAVLEDVFRRHPLFVGVERKR